MKREFLLSVAVTLALTGMAGAGTPVTIGGFSNPESVLIAGPVRYVSNLGARLDPLAKDGDGFISLLDQDGKILDLRAFAGLDSPKGMAMAGGKLFVADIDRVVGFDPFTRKQDFVARMDCAQPCLLNDIAVAGDRLLVTDTLRGRLYGLDPVSGAFTMLADGIAGANGVVWDSRNDRAIVVALGADFGGGDIYGWSETAGLHKLPNSPHGIFDGVALLPDGDIVVSDWVSLTPHPGILSVVDPATGKAQAIALQQPIRGPADFALDPADHALWVPAMVDGTVDILPLPAD